MGNIVNKIDLHDTEACIDLIDTIDNRSLVIKSIFSRLVVTKLKQFIGSTTSSMNDPYDNLNRKELNSDKIRFAEINYYR